MLENARAFEVKPGRMSIAKDIDRKIIIYHGRQEVQRKRKPVF